MTARSHGPAQTQLRHIRKHGDPPDKQEKAADAVLEQAEALLVV